MDEFGRAQDRYEKRHGRVLEVATGHTPIPELKPQETKTPKPFTVLTIDMTNGDEVYSMTFSSDDLLENMMHSDRTEDGVREKLLSILQTHLTTGLR